MRMGVLTKKAPLIYDSYFARSATWDNYLKSTSCIPDGTVLDIACPVLGVKRCFAFMKKPTETARMAGEVRVPLTPTLKAQCLQKTRHRKKHCTMCVCITRVEILFCK